MLDHKKEIIISIHSLRVEGDCVPRAGQVPAADFNPLPPCGGRHFCGILYISHKNFNPLPPCGGRLKPPEYTDTRSLFQSTPSVWRETPCTPWTCLHSAFQSTPSVWRETRFPDADRFRRGFQSTPSVWRETTATPVPTQRFTISIHSLRVEGDCLTQIIQLVIVGHFNPLPPCGGRPMTDAMTDGVEKFQSTPSVWRETPRWNGWRSWFVISIHSLRVEGDRASAAPDL